MHPTIKLLLLMVFTTSSAVLLSYVCRWGYLEYTIKISHEISVVPSKPFAAVKFNSSISEFPMLLNKVQTNAIKAAINPVNIYTQYFKFFHKRFLDEISHNSDMEALCGIDFTGESLDKIQFFLIKNTDYKYFLLPKVKVIKFTYPVSDNDSMFNYVSGQKLMRAIETEVLKIDSKKDLKKLTMLESTSVPTSDSLIQVTFSVPIGTFSDDYELVINHF